MPIKIQVNNNSVIINDIPINTSISAYTLEGELLNSTTSLSENVTLKIPASIKAFILKIGNKSIKIIL